MGSMIDMTKVFDTPEEVPTPSYGGVLGTSAAEIQSVIPRYATVDVTKVFDIEEPEAPAPVLPGAPITQSGILSNPRDTGVLSNPRNVQAPDIPVVEPPAFAKVDITKVFDEPALPKLPPVDPAVAGGVLGVSGDDVTKFTAAFSSTQDDPTSKLEQERVATFNSTMKKFNEQGVDLGSQDQLEKIGTSVASAIREDVKKRGDDASYNALKTSSTLFGDSMWVDEDTHTALPVSVIMFGSYSAQKKDEMSPVLREVLTDKDKFVRFLSLLPDTKQGKIARSYLCVLQDNMAKLSRGELDDTTGRKMEELIRSASSEGLSTALGAFVSPFITPIGGIALSLGANLALQQSFSNRVAEGTLYGLELLGKGFSKAKMDTIIREKLRPEYVADDGSVLRDKVLAAKTPSLGSGTAESPYLDDMFGRAAIDALSGRGAILPRYGVVYNSSSFQGDLVGNAIVNAGIALASPKTTLANAAIRFGAKVLRDAGVNVGAGSAVAAAYSTDTMQQALASWSDENDSRLVSTAKQLAPMFLTGAAGGKAADAVLSQLGKQGVGRVAASISDQITRLDLSSPSLNKSMEALALFAKEFDAPTLGTRAPVSVVASASGSGGAPVDPAVHRDTLIEAYDYLLNMHGETMPKDQIVAWVDSIPQDARLAAVSQLATLVSPNNVKQEFVLGRGEDGTTKLQWQTTLPVDTTKFVVNGEELSLFPTRQADLSPEGKLKAPEVKLSQEEYVKVINILSGNVQGTQFSDAAAKFQDEGSLDRILKDMGEDPERQQIVVHMLNQALAPQAKRTHAGFILSKLMNDPSREDAVVAASRYTDSVVDPLVFAHLATTSNVDKSSVVSTMRMPRNILAVLNFTSDLIDLVRQSTYDTHATGLLKETVRSLIQSSADRFKDANLPYVADLEAGRLTSPSEYATHYLSKAPSVDSDEWFSYMKDFVGALQRAVASGLRSVADQERSTPRVDTTLIQVPVDKQAVTDFGQLLLFNGVDKQLRSIPRAVNAKAFLSKFIVATKYNEDNVTKQVSKVVNDYLDYGNASVYNRLQEVYGTEGSVPVSVLRAFRILRGYSSAAVKDELTKTLDVPLTSIRQLASYNIVPSVYRSAYTSTPGGLRSGSGLNTDLLVHNIESSLAAMQKVGSTVRQELLAPVYYAGLGPVSPISILNNTVYWMQQFAGKDVAAAKRAVGPVLLAYGTSPHILKTVANTLTTTIQSSKIGSLFSTLAHTTLPKEMSALCHIPAAELPGQLNKLLLLNTDLSERFRVRVAEVLNQMLSKKNVEKYVSKESFASRSKGNGAIRDVAVSLIGEYINQFRDTKTPGTTNALSYAASYMAKHPNMDWRAIMADLDMQLKQVYMDLLSSQSGFDIHGMSFDAVKYTNVYGLLELLKVQTLNRQFQHSVGHLLQHLAVGDLPVLRRLFSLRADATREEIAERVRDHASTFAASVLYRNAGFTSMAALDSSLEKNFFVFDGAQFVKDSLAALDLYSDLKDSIHQAVYDPTSTTVTPMLIKEWVDQVDSLRDVTQTLLGPDGSLAQFLSLEMGELLRKRSLNGLDILSDILHQFDRSPRMFTLSHTVLREAMQEFNFVFDHTYGALDTFMRNLISDSLAQGGTLTNASIMHSLLEPLGQLANTGLLVHKVKATVHHLGRLVGYKKFTNRIAEVWHNVLASPKAAWAMRVVAAPNYGYSRAYIDLSSQLSRRQDNMDSNVQIIQEQLLKSATLPDEFRSFIRTLCTMEDKDTARAILTAIASHADPSIPTGAKDLLNQMSMKPDDLPEGIRLLDVSSMGSPAVKGYADMAKQVGVRIQWMEDSDRYHSFYDPKTNTMYLSFRNGDEWSPRYQFGHELIHRMEQQSPTRFEELLNSRFHFSMSEVRDFRNNVLQRTGNVVPGTDRALTGREVRVEMLARYAGEMLASPGFRFVNNPEMNKFLDETAEFEEGRLTPELTVPGRMQGAVQDLLVDYFDANRRHRIFGVEPVSETRANQRANQFYDLLTQYNDAGLLDVFSSVMFSPLQFAVSKRAKHTILTDAEDFHKDAALYEQLIERITGAIQGKPEFDNQSPQEVAALTADLALDFSGSLLSAATSNIHVLGMLEKVAPSLAAAAVRLRAVMSSVSMHAFHEGQITAKDLADNPDYLPWQYYFAGAADKQKSMESPVVVNRMLSLFKLYLKNYEVQFKARVVDTITTGYKELLYANELRKDAVQKAAAAPEDAALARKVEDATARFQKSYDAMSKSIATSIVNAPFIVRFLGRGFYDLATDVSVSKVAGIEKVRDLLSYDPIFNPLQVAERLPRVMDMILDTSGALQKSLLADDYEGMYHALEREVFGDNVDVWFKSLDTFLSDPSYAIVRQDLTKAVYNAVYQQDPTGRTLASVINSKLFAYASYRSGLFDGAAMRSGGPSLRPDTNPALQATLKFAMSRKNMDPSYRDSLWVVTNPFTLIQRAVHNLSRASSTMRYSSALMEGTGAITILPEEDQFIHKLYDTEYYHKATLNDIALQGDVGEWLVKRIQSTPQYKLYLYKMMSSRLAAMQGEVADSLSPMQKEFLGSVLHDKVLGDTLAAMKKQGNLVVAIDRNFWEELVALTGSKEGASSSTFFGSKVPDGMKDSLAMASVALHQLRFLWQTNVLIQNVPSYMRNLTGALILPVLTLGPVNGLRYVARAATALMSEATSGSRDHQYLLEYGRLYPQVETGSLRYAIKEYKYTASPRKVGERVAYFLGGLGPVLPLLKATNWAGSQVFKTLFRIPGIKQLASHYGMDASSGYTAMMSMRRWYSSVDIITNLAVYMAAREGNVRTPDVLAFAPTRGVSNLMKKRAAYLDIGEGNEFRAFREGKSPKMTPEEAVRYMDRFCFSYRDVPALVRAGTLVWNPFLGFTYNAGRIMKNLLSAYPVRTLASFLVMDIIKDQLEDSYGVDINLDYIVPGYNIAQMAADTVGLGPMDNYPDLDPLNWGAPLVKLYKLLSEDKDPFTGEEYASPNFLVKVKDAIFRSVVPVPATPDLFVRLALQGTNSLSDKLFALSMDPLELQRKMDALVPQSWGSKKVIENSILGKPVDRYMTQQGTTAGILYMLGFNLKVKDLVLISARLRNAETRLNSLEATKLRWMYSSEYVTNQDVSRKMRGLDKEIERLQKSVVQYVKSMGVPVPESLKEYDTDNFIESLASTIQTTFAEGLGFNSAPPGWSDIRR